MLDFMQSYHSYNTCLLIVPNINIIARKGYVIINILSPLPQKQKQNNKYNIKNDYTNFMNELKNIYFKIQKNNLIKQQFSQFAENAKNIIHKHIF